MNAGGGCCHCYERKGNSSGKNHGPEHEEDGHRADGPRGHERPDPGADRPVAGREPGGGGRGERGDRPRGARPPRPPPERAGCGADPPPVGEHDARAGPEQQGPRELGDERPEDGGGRGIDAREHRG